MIDEEAGWRWHDQRGVTWAAGLAAVALIVILVWAVMRTATGSSSGPGVVPSSTSLLTTTARKTPTSTTSYPLPSVLTSEGSAPPAPPAVETPAVDEPTSTAPTSTTTVNPYVTTTQPPGGAV